MTNGGSEPGLDVAVTTVRPRRRDRRRAAIAGSAIVALVAVGFGLSRLGPGASPSPAPGFVARDPSSSPAGSLGGPTSAPSSVPAQALLPIDDTPLPGAPTVMVTSRSDGDLVMTGWTPGSGLRVLETFDGALRAGPASPEDPRLSPDGSAVLLLSNAETRTPLGQGPARVFVEGRGVVWETGAATVDLGGVWSADSRQVLLAGPPGTWLVVTIPTDGPATSQEVRLELPDNAPDPSTGQERTAEPVAFSADGAWLYGILGFRDEPNPPRVVRMHPDGSGAEMLDAWPLGDEPARPAPFPDWLVDPISGRTTRFVLSAAPRSLAVLEPDGSRAFVVEGETILGSSWIGDGTLAVAVGDGADLPTAVTFSRYDPAGNAQPLLRTLPIEGAAYIGAREGYVGFAILVREPMTAAQLVLIRLEDGLTTATRIEDGIDDIVGLGWAP